MVLRHRQGTGSCTNPRPPAHVPTWGSGGGIRWHHAEGLLATGYPADVSTGFKHHNKWMQLNQTAEVPSSFKFLRCGCDLVRFYDWKRLVEAHVATSFFDCHLMEPIG